jgi:hypothetical protein
MDLSKEFQQLLTRLQQFVPEVQLEKSPQNLLDMQQPASATKSGGHNVQQQPDRMTSANTAENSQTCSIT